MEIDVVRNGHERTDREIDQTGAQALQAFEARDVVQTHLNARMSAAELLDEPGEKIKNGGCAGGDFDMALIDFQAPQTELFIQMAQLLNERQGHLEEEFAVVGEL